MLKELQNKLIFSFNTGLSIKQLASLYNVCEGTIRNNLKLNNINPARERIKSNLTKEQKEEIVKLYLSGKKIKEIANIFKIKNCNVSYVLSKTNIVRRNGKTKGGFSEIAKQKIIELYTKKHRGKSYIGKLFDRRDSSISYYLKKWGVPNLSRSLICKEIRKIYGSTKGFSGRKHKQTSKDKSSNSGKKAWLFNKREPKIGKSKTFNTIIGKVLGSYEVAYLQDLYDKNEKLPKKGKKIITPLGTYTPDFDFTDKFVEIKSAFTLKASKGNLKYYKGNYSNQYKKIEWVNTNIKKIEIKVLNSKEAANLFKKAVKDRTVLLDEVIIKNGLYTIIKRYKKGG